ncbi:hypothetical protein B6K85_24570 [Vibrio sp. V1B]|uniref:hypothetical protein n=1 Tax=Vibrio sp. V1B TaxID=2047825 RepID=UPI000BB07210|nr:hypothetical protein [Vibrio sp. V1B]PAW08035.1 hypothetical protein B6K85_24570 [Vibrio sp. V1B]
MKSAWLLALSMIAFGCSAKQDVEPKSVTLVYDHSKLTAEIQADNHFEAHVDNDKERIDLFGLVRKLHPDYQLDVSVIKSSKTQHATNQISTSLLIKQKEIEKPILIGGVYQHTVVNDENNNPTVTESASVMSVKLNL